MSWKKEEPPGQAALQGWRYDLVGMGMGYNAWERV
jgi:hypothetical protein